MSPDRQLNLQDLTSNGSLHVQIKTLRLNGQTTVNLFEKLFHMVTKLTTKATQLQSDNAVLEAQISELQDILSTKSCHTEAAAGTVPQTWSHVIQRHPGKQSTTGKEREYKKKAPGI